MNPISLRELNEIKFAKDISNTNCVYLVSEEIGIPIPTLPLTC